MKKQYSKPTCEIVTIALEEVLTTSQSVNIEGYDYFSPDWVI